MVREEQTAKKNWQFYTSWLQHLMQELRNEKGERTGTGNKQIKGENL